jgi:hypothetical protein
MPRQQRRITDGIFELGAKTVESGWQDAVADQLATILNNQLWQEMQKKRGNRRFCDSMAAMAKDLDRAAEAPQGIAGWLAGRIALWFGHPPLVQRMARNWPSR